VTQNVDGLHDRAGSRAVCKLHGEPVDAALHGLRGEAHDERVPLPELPPRCEGCGGMLRPGVVWFGEALPEAALDAAWQAASACEVMLVVGTSAVVYPGGRAGAAGPARGRARD
jgi:NAD-dependent deacetylase